MVILEQGAIKQRKIIKRSMEQEKKFRSKSKNDKRAGSINKRKVSNENCKKIGNWLDMERSINDKGI